MWDILISALSTSFFLVRVVKGPWMRNPQYLAAATIGAVAISLVLDAVAPAIENSFIAGGLAGAAGAWAGIAAFDFIAAN
jgi:hypothetical protein